LDCVGGFDGGGGFIRGGIFDVSGGLMEKVMIAVLVLRVPVVLIEVVLLMVL